MYTDPYRELESVFIIDVPVLDILSLIDNCGTRYVLENPLPIVERRLWWFTPKRQDLLGKHTYALRNLEKNFGLVNTFSQVKRLDLNNNDMADLGIADVKDWPFFSNLLELWVIVSGDPGFKSLSVLLIKAPMLESLNFVNEQSGQGNPHTWYKPQGSPRYLLTCLRTINLTIKGSQTDLSLIKCLLGNVRGLRKMTISFDIGKAKGDEFYGKLAKFPRRSQTCDITINDHLWIQGSKSCNAGLKRKFDESHIIVLD